MVLGKLATDPRGGSKRSIVPLCSGMGFHRLSLLIVAAAEKEHMYSGLEKNFPSNTEWWTAASGSSGHGSRRKLRSLTFSGL